MHRPKQRRPAHIYVPPADFKREYHLRSEWAHVVDEPVPRNAYERTVYLRVCMDFVERMMAGDEPAAGAASDADLARLVARIEDFRLANRADLLLTSFHVDDAWTHVDQASLFWMLECRWRVLRHARNPDLLPAERFEPGGYAPELRDQIRLFVGSVKNFRQMTLENLRVSITALRRRWKKVDPESDDVRDYMRVLALVCAEYASYARTAPRLNSNAWSPDGKLAPRFFRDTDLFFYELARSTRTQRYLRATLFASQRLEEQIEAALPRFDEWYGRLKQTVYIDEALKMINARAMESELYLGETELYMRERHGVQSAFTREQTAGVIAAAPTARDIVEHFRPDCAQEVDAIFDMTLERAGEKYPLDTFVEICDYLSKQYAKLSLSEFSVSARALGERWPDLARSFDRQASPLVVRTDRDELYVYLPTCKRFYNAGNDPRKALLAWLWQADACESTRSEHLGLLICAFFGGEHAPAKRAPAAPNRVLL